MCHFYKHVTNKCSCVVLKFSEVLENPENPENFPRKPVGRNFREFREIFSGDSREFRKSPGTFPEIWGFFPERALRSSVHAGKTG